LAFGALGAVGLVEWPVILAVGGGALLLRKLSQKSEAPAPAPKATLKPVPTEPAPEKAPARKAASKPAAKKAGGRRAGSTELRSTN
jgi:hypothetical protein